MMTYRRQTGIGTAQGAAVLTLLAVLIVSPPLVGPMLVLPLGRTNQGELVNMTMRHGGVLLGAGPLPGSLLVYGRRSSLRAALWGMHAVLLAAPTLLCGKPPIDRPDRGSA